MATPKTLLRVGDEVKISYLGLTSDEWFKVKSLSVFRNGSLFVEICGKYFTFDEVEILEHRSSFPIGRRVKMVGTEYNGYCGTITGLSQYKDSYVVKWDMPGEDGWRLDSDFGSIHIID